MFFEPLKLTFDFLFNLQLTAKPFTDKELFEKVQMHVEARLNANAAFVHPYCLSLDSIGNALFSLVTNKCVTKQTIAGGKPATRYTAHLNELDRISGHLRRYCSALKQFHGLSNYLMNSKL